MEPIANSKGSFLASCVHCFSRQECWKKKGTSTNEQKEEVFEKEDVQAEGCAYKGEFPRNWFLVASAFAKPDAETILKHPRVTIPPFVSKSGSAALRVARALYRARRASWGRMGCNYRST